MSIEFRKDEIKLDILNSLARSQKALSLMIENVAELSNGSGNLSQHLKENIEVLSRYQQTLAIKLTGIRISSKKIGKPTKPWLQQELKLKCNL